MWEFYWITRFDAITAMFGSLAFVTVIIGIVFLIILGSNYGYRKCKNPDSTYHDEYCLYKLSKKVLKSSIVGFLICILGVTFIPSTKDALLIYGVGGTIDYVKNNDKAKQLPDKVINALDRYVDSIANDSIQNDKARSE